MSHAIKDLAAALRRLELSPAQQAVFLSLVQEGPGSARTLAARTSLTRPSVYDQLKVLRQVGLVHELLTAGKTTFAATDLAQVDNLLADKIERIERSRASLAAAQADLANTAQTVSPKIRFFEGSEEVKNILKDVLWNAQQTITITWPTAVMAEVFDAAYLSWFAERLAAHQYSISLRATHHHPFTAVTTYKKIPAERAPAMATIQYGTRTAHISSPSEAFGFIVESHDYSTLSR